MILDLLAIGFIGTLYFRLAKEYEKIAWLFAVLGVLSYYGGVFLSAFLFSIYEAYVNNNLLDESDTLLILAVSLPGGIVCCFVLFQLLKRNWKRKAAAVQEDSNLLDDTEMLDEEIS